MNETILRIKSVFDATGAKKASSAMEKLSNAVKETSGHTSKANGIFTNFFSGLTRIAKLRMLRGIIRSITSAFKEGTENLYHYSQALGAADASHFANTMDSLASSLLYMKNSIGAVVAPLLTSLLPTIQTIINAFVRATQAVAQFFAALGGQVTFTRAKEHATVWKDIGTAAGGAAAAAKEYQNTILSFDEIHALNDVPTSGGGGGGGKATPDYSDMFEEASISPKIREFVEWLKDNWKDILDIVVAIGAAIKLWQIAKNVLDFFNNLGLLKNAKGASQLTLGLILSVVGVTLSAKGGFSIAYEGVDLMNVIKTAVGVALAGAGGALVAKGLTTLGVASVGTGVGAVVGIGIALVATIVGFELGYRAKLVDNAKASLEEYVGQVDQILNRQNGYIDVSKQAWENYDNTVFKLGFAKKLTDDLGVLADKEHLSNYEVDLAKKYIDDLNNLGLDGIRAEWNETTGRIEINTQEIYNNIEAIKEHAKTAAMEEILTQAYKDQFQAEMDREKAARDVVKAETDMRKRADELGISYDKLTQNTHFATWATEDETSALGIANKELEHATQNYDDATEVVNFYEDALYGSKSATVEEARAVVDATKKQGDYNQKVGDATTQITTFKENADKTKTTIGNVTQSTNIGKDSWSVYADAIVNAQRAKYDGSSATGGLSDVGWFAQDAATKVKDLANKLASLNGTEVHFSASGTLHGGGGFSYKADGGFVQAFDGGGVKSINSADIFLANENGSAELIGRIGNRTAVANQQQMVDVLASGLVHVMDNMQNGQTSNLEVNVMMDREVLAKAVDRGNRSLNRRYNVSLA